ncbi:hypothetical protein MPER_07431, partial [Moniliophthora perniciosa FA553]
MSASVTETINQAPDAIVEEFSSKLNLHSPPPPELPHWEPPKTTEEEVEWADILTVDLSLYETKRQELIDTIAVALERDGFFYVTNHGIPREI